MVTPRRVDLRGAAPSSYRDVLPRAALDVEVALDVVRPEQLTLDSVFSESSIDFTGESLRAIMTEVTSAARPMKRILEMSQRLFFGSRIWSCASDSGRRATMVPSFGALV